MTRGAISHKAFSCTVHVQVYSTLCMYLPTNCLYLSYFIDFNCKIVTIWCWLLTLIKNYILFASWVSFTLWELRVLAATQAKQTTPYKLAKLRLFFSLQFDESWVVIIQASLSKPSKYWWLNKVHNLSLCVIKYTTKIHLICLICSVNIQKVKTVKVLNTNRKWEHDTD